MAGNQDDIVIGVSLDTKTIKTGVNRVVGDIDYITQAASRSFDALGKRIDKAIPTSVQTRIQNMVGIGTKSTKEWTGALAQQGAELEKLRTKYNPIFAAIKQYQASVVDIQQAHRVGAISADEMAAAIQRERKATLDSIAAIKQRNGAIASMRSASNGPSRYNTANIAAQFQDIAVTSAMGMSPIQIALQQGTQLSAVFNEMGKGRDVIKGIGAAFMSIVSPVSLATIGIIAGGTALAQYIMSLKSDLPTVDEALKRHADIVQEIGRRWPGATEGMERYMQQSTAVMEKNARENLKVFQKASKEAQEAFSTAVSLSTSITGGAPTRLVDQRFKPFEDAINRLRDSVKSGRPDFDAFYRQINEIVATDPKNLQEIGDKTITLAEAMQDADQKVRAAKASIGLIGAAAAAQVQQISQFTAAIRELAGIGLPQLDERGLAEQQYNIAKNRATDREGRDDAYRAYQAALNRILEKERLSRVPTPGEKPNLESIALPKEKKLSSERQAQRDANAYRDLVKSAQDRIDQLKLEEQLVGKTGVAAETMRMKLELLQRAQDKGRNVSAAQRAEIEKLAEAYGKAAEKVAAMSLAEELQFERAQMFRSPTEQRVYSQLRSAGISPDSEYGQAIGNQIRLNEQLAEGKDLATDFAQGLANDLLNGVSAMDALANAAKNLGAKLIEIGTNQVINSLFSSLAGGLGGGSGFGSSYFPPIPGGIGLFDSGGYTGAGGKYQPAGIVHKGEYVVPKNVVDRIGVGNIERLMGGFANGGLVGGPRVPSIPAAANSNSSSFTFAPVIDARGADVAAVARLEQIVAKQQAEFSGRVVQTMRQAKSTRNWRG